MLTHLFVSLQQLQDTQESLKQAQVRERLLIDDNKQVRCCPQTLTSIAFQRAQLCCMANWYRAPEPRRC